MGIFIHNIIVQGCLKLNHILELSIRNVPGAHSQAYLKAELDESVTTIEMLESLSGKKIKIEEKSSGKKKPLFYGYIAAYEYQYKKAYFEVEIRLLSASYLLDQEKKSRSFQDITMSYRDIVTFILKETPNTDVIFTCEDKKIEKPLLQYKETDWEFIKRLASHFQTTLIPEIFSGEPKFWFGAIKEGGEIEFPKDNYQVKIDQRFYELGGKEAGFQKRDFLYYEFHSLKNYEIGDSIQIKGRQMWICMKFVKLEKGQLVFWYQLGSEKLLAVRKKYNKKIVGCSLNGIVLETEKEHIKLHLDIDQEQPVEKAYFYSWIPETGNLFYCMPQIGTKAVLYIPEEDEQKAAAVRCIRVNGENCKEIQDFEKRFMTSEHGKRMHLFPEGIGFHGKNTSSSLQMQVSDNNGIEIKSDQKIMLTSEEGIVIQARNIKIFAPKQITVVKSNKQANTIFNICNQFDAIGKVGGLTGSDTKKLPKLTEKSKKKKEISSLILKTAIAAIPSSNIEKGIEMAAIGAIANCISVKREN